MCLIFFSYQKHPLYKFIGAFNRDEFYLRPTATADFWEDYPDIIGGRDLQAGGTWLGMTRSGKIAAITNYRDPKRNKNNVLSRGLLIREFLTQKTSTEEYLVPLVTKQELYNGYNLIVSDGEKFGYYSNYQNQFFILSSGVYGLCNHLLDTPWPKLAVGKAGFTKALEHNNREAIATDLFVVMSNDTPFLDQPDTGVGEEWERLLSSVFIKSSTYGTVSTTLIFISNEDKVYFVEKTHGKEGGIVEYEFKIEG